MASPGSCLGVQRALTALGAKDIAAAAPRRAREQYRTDTLAPKLSPAEAYRVAAPSTVIIRTRMGLGSGVVVDARGYVLTNHHVVDDFLQPDLTMNVSLELGEAEPTGRVRASGRVFRGVVVKADAVKDLALVRIEDAPKGLVPIRLGDDPKIGEDVVSIGHAGIGLLWAAKVCNVSGVGDQTRDTSMLEVGDCKIHDRSDTDAEAKRHEEQCEAKKRQIREEVASSTQGLAVQTSCNITHGDSGGPLLNVSGELVGLNQSIRFDAATVAFHVHVAEVRAFLQSFPETASQILPDPWCEGGSEASVEDIDGDGKKETLKLVGSSIGHAFGMDSAEATFIDLDEDDDAARRTKERPFDADVVVLRKHDDVFVFYDTDGDGRFDVLLRDKEAEGHVDLAWRRVGDKFVEDASLKKGGVVDVGLVKEAPGKTRLGAIARALGWSKLASPATLAMAESLAVPDPFSGTVKVAQAIADRPNEKPFAVHWMGPSGDGMFIDTRSPGLAALKQGDDARTLLERRALTPDFAMLGRPNGRWALYDTDGDGRLDLGLFARNPADDPDEPGATMAQFVTDAFDLRGPAPKRVTDHLGRAVIRYKLLGSEKARKAATSLPYGDSADDGRGSFPQPLHVFMMRAPWRLADLKKGDRRVLERSDKLGGVALVDLDGDTKGLASKGADELVRQQSFEWEVAFMKRGNLLWGFYDTDNDGAYDLVLFSRAADKGTVDAAYTLSRSGDRVTAIPPAGVVLQPERVTRGAAEQAAITAAYQRIFSARGE